MKITRKRLQQIVSEERAKLNEVSSDWGAPHYAHSDIVIALVEVIDPEWIDVSREQMRLALEDAMKQLALDSEESEANLYKTHNL